MPRDRKSRKEAPGSFYRRPNSPWVWYKLHVKGEQPFRGATSHQSEKEAKADKQQIYADALSKIADRRKNSATVLNSTMTTFGDASDLYYRQVGALLNDGGEGAKNELKYLEWLCAPRAVGRDRKLTAIDDAVLQTVMSIRQREEKKRGVDKRGRPIFVKGSRVSKATVNRSVLEPFRRVMYFARDIGKVRDLQIIDWAKYRLGVPRGRVREMDDMEEITLLVGGADGEEPALREDYRPMLQVGKMMGFRTTEQRTLEWSDVKWFVGESGKIRLRARKGHDGGEQYVSMPPAVRDVLRELWDMPGRHEKFVFTWVSAKNDPARGHRKGERYPYSKSGWKSAWRRATAKAGIEGLRYYDASRHTAGSRNHRDGMSIAGVSELLGHADISTTQIYTHARDADMVETMQHSAEKTAARQAELLKSLKIRAHKAGTLVPKSKKTVG